MKRGAVTKKEATLVSVWLPIELDAAIQRAVLVEDSDKSKFIRKAVRDRINRVLKEAK